MPHVGYEGARRALQQLHQTILDLEMDIEQSGGRGKDIPIKMIQLKEARSQRDALVLEFQVNGLNSSAKSARWAGIAAGASALATVLTLGYYVLAYLYPPRSAPMPPAAPVSCNCTSSAVLPHEPVPAKAKAMKAGPATPPSDSGSPPPKK